MIELPPLPLPLHEMGFFVKRRKDGCVEIWAAPYISTFLDETQTFIAACGDQWEARYTLDQIAHLQRLAKGLTR